MNVILKISSQHQLNIFSEITEQKLTKKWSTYFSIRQNDMEIETVINEEFCFKLDLNPSIIEIQQALDAYSKNLDSEITLETETPIFLDTNVLLDYYKLSFSERKSLIKYFEENKGRLYITHQVQEEFLRHRVNHIKSYLNSVEEFVKAYRNIRNEIESLKKGEVKGFEHYLNNNRILKNDHQDLHTELTNLHSTLQEKLKGLFNESDLEKQLEEKEQRIEDIKKRLEGDADIKRNDPLLNVIATFNFLPSLSDDEINYIKGLYKKLESEFVKVKADQNEFYKKTFPGAGDKKEDPTGDLVIFHEILKFQKENKSDAIFLTNDTEKNDWLLRKKADLVPFSHYIINTHLNTNQSLYIFQSRDKLLLTYNSIYIDDSEVTEEGVIMSQPDEGERPSDQLETPNIIGRIDLNNSENHFSFYDSISEDEFLNQLQRSEIWANKYGDGFVGVRNFVEKYLGPRGYDYQESYKVKEDLVAKGVIIEYTHEPDEDYYNPVTAIRIKK